MAYGIHERTFHLTIPIATMSSGMSTANHRRRNTKRKHKPISLMEEEDDVFGAESSIDVMSHRAHVEGVTGTVGSGVQVVDSVEELERVFRETGLDRIVVYRHTEGASKHGLGDLKMWYPVDVLTQFTTELHHFVDPDMEIPTIDVRTQEEGPMFTIRDVQRYFRTPIEKRERLLNIVSFNLGLTELDGFVVPPRIVRDLDLVRRAWPRNAVARFQEEDVWNPFAFLYFPEEEEGETEENEEEDLERQQGQQGTCNDTDTTKARYGVYAAPQTMTYLLLGPAGAYTDWHMDMGGSSVWYHVIQGKKVFMAAPDTQHNVDAFLRWSSSEEQVTFLGTHLEHCVRVTLHPGDTMFLPGGWLHAVSTPKDSIVIGGNYVNPMRLDQALNVVGVEQSLNVSRDARYPKYEMLMYYAACDFIRRIERSKHIFDHRTMLTHLEEAALPCLVTYFEALVGSLVKRAARKHKNAAVFKAHVDACVERMDIVIRLLRKEIEYLASIKSAAQHVASYSDAGQHGAARTASALHQQQQMFGGRKFGRTLHNVQAFEKRHT